MKITIYWHLLAHYLIDKAHYIFLNFIVSNDSNAFEHISPYSSLEIIKASSPQHSQRLCELMGLFEFLLIKAKKTALAVGKTLLDFYD